MMPPRIFLARLVMLGPCRHFAEVAVLFTLVFVGLHAAGAVALVLMLVALTPAAASPPPDEPAGRSGRHQGLPDDVFNAQMLDLCGRILSGLCAGRSFQARMMRPQARQDAVRVAMQMAEEAIVQVELRSEYLITTTREQNEAAAAAAAKKSEGETATPQDAPPVAGPAMPPVPAREIPVSELPPLPPPPR